MASKLDRTTKIVITGLIVLGVGVAIAYVTLRYFRSDLYYVEVDGVTRTRDSVVTSVRFVQVGDYDSLNVRDVSAEIIRKSLDSQELDVTKYRQYLFHIYTTSDTAALSQDMVDELAYTNPRIEDPKSVLCSVQNGWIISYKFAPYRVQPRGFEMVRTYFYMPRNGVKLKDIEF